MAMKPVRRALGALLWMGLLVAVPESASAVDGRAVTRVDYTAPDTGEHGTFRRAGIESWTREGGGERARFAEMGRDVDTIYLLDVSRRLYVRLDLAARQVFMQRGRYAAEYPAFRIAAVYAVDPQNVTTVVYGDASGHPAGRFERWQRGWREVRSAQQTLPWRAAGHDENALFLDSQDGNQSVRLDLYRMEMTRLRLGDRQSLERLPILRIDGPPVPSDQSSPST